MPLPKQKIADARERLDRVADVYWGLHGTLGASNVANQTDKILEKVLIDYALCGKVPIDTLKKNAQAKVKELHETHG